MISHQSHPRFQILPHTLQPNRSGVLDWKIAIQRNRKALGDVIAELVALAQQAMISPLEGEMSAKPTEGGRGPDAKTPPSALSGQRVEPQVSPRPSDPAARGENGGGHIAGTSLRRAVLRILRPAESALRRLIVVVAAMLSQRARETTEQQGEIQLPDFSTFATYDTLPAFQLIDPRKTFGEFSRPVAKGIPRIAVPGVFDPVPLKKPDNTLQAVKLIRRIRKLQYALHTLPRQARRLNRLMARRANAEPGPRKVGPIRPGNPPGHRKRPREPVDDLLRECHWLAQECARQPP